MMVMVSMLVAVVDDDNGDNNVNGDNSNTSQ